MARHSTIAVLDDPTPREILRQLSYPSRTVSVGSPAAFPSPVPQYLSARACSPGRVATEAQARTPEGSRACSGGGKKNVGYDPGGSKSGAFPRGLGMSSKATTKS